MIYADFQHLLSAESLSRKRFPAKCPQNYSYLLRLSKKSSTYF